MYKKDINWALPLLILLVTLLAFFRSPYFYVYEIEKDESTYFPLEELLAGIDLPLGKNIFMVDRTRLSHLILENPRVKGVEIMRRLPQTLKFTIQEQRPLAYLYQDERLFLSGCQGVVIRKEEVPGGFSLPYYYSDKEITVGEKVPATFLQYIPLLSSFSPKFLAGLKELDCSAENMVLYFTAGGRALLDSNFSLQESSQLELLYLEMEEKKLLDYIDMRYKGNPVMKFIK